MERMGPERVGFKIQVIKSLGCQGLRGQWEKVFDLLELSESKQRSYQGTRVKEGPTKVEQLCK